MNPSIAHIVDTAEAVVIEKELVLDGTEANYRAIKLEYTLENSMVIETRNYLHPSSSPAWGSFNANYILKTNIDA